jgi:hypothetical protein
MEKDMYKIIVIFLVLFQIALSQTWRSSSNLNISAGSDERIDLFTNASGNHLVVQ